MFSNALYTDLLACYDLICADIDYRAQSHSAHRVQQLFDVTCALACGTEPHVRHFIDARHQSAGLNINQPMLDQAAARCSESRFSVVLPG